MVEQNFSGYNNAFKFNGKEQDPETGMYYYGARYYDPKMSLFVSVDPLTEQFVGWSPYNYTMNNPLNLTDPTGMAPEGWGKKGNTWEYKQEITRENYKSLGYEDYMSAGNIYSSDGEYNYSLNADGSVQNTQGNYMNDSFSTPRGTTITVNQGNSASKTASNLNSYFGFVATGIENSPGSLRLATTKQGFSPKYYGNAWRGNQYARTYKVGNIGSALGKLSFGAGLALDGYGVYEYTKNPSSNSAVHPGRMGVNTTMGILGFTGWGAPASLLYGGLEAFYPGGTLGAMKDNSDAQAIYRKHNNGAVIKPSL